MRTRPAYSFQVIGDALSCPDPVESLQIFIAEKGMLQSPHEVQLSRLTWEAKNLFLVHQLLREVLGGGFSTFFTNTAGVYSCETLVALRELKADVTAELLADLLDQFPSSQPPKDRLSRYALVESLGREFENRCARADDIFYEQVDTHREQSSRAESLWKLSLSYIQEHVASSILTD